MFHLPFWSSTHTHLVSTYIPEDVDQNSPIELFKLYSLWGIPAVSHKLLLRGSTLAPLHASVWRASCSVKQWHLLWMASLKLLPFLIPFDGKNPHSIVVIDNASIHHIDGISEVITAAGALFVFLPRTYLTTTPLRRHFQRSRYTSEPTTELGGMDFKDIILLAFVQINPTDCYNWINQYGIYIWYYWKSNPIIYNVTYHYHYNYYMSIVNFQVRVSKLSLLKLAQRIQNWLFAQ